MTHSSHWCWSSDCRVSAALHWDRYCGWVGHEMHSYFPLDLCTAWITVRKSWPYGNRIVVHFPMEADVFSYVLVVAPPQLPPSLLHITESHSCHAEQRSGLPASTCGSGFGRSDTVLFSFFFFSFCCCNFQKSLLFEKSCGLFSVSQWFYLLSEKKYLIIVFPDVCEFCPVHAFN